jgi:hypothetical protein
MEHEVEVKYSVKEEKFKADELDRLNVDPECRKNLVDLFSTLSQNKKYLVMAKTAPIILWLVAVSVIIALVILFIIIGFAAGRKRSELSNPVDLNSISSRDKAGSSNPNNNNPSQSTDKNESSSNPRDNRNIMDKNRGPPPMNHRGNHPPGSNSDNRSSDGADRRRDGKRLLQARDDDDDEDAFPEKDGRFLNEMKVAIGFTCLILFVFLVMFLMFECRKRHVYTQLREFENRTLETDTHLWRSQVEIQDDHSRKKIMRCMPCFNVYNFKFIVSSLGPCKERNLLIDNERQTNLRDSEITLVNFQNDNIGNDFGSENKGTRLNDYTVHINHKMA